ADGVGRRRQGAALALPQGAPRPGGAPAQEEGAIKHERASAGAERGDPGGRRSRATWSPAPARASGANMSERAPARREATLEGGAAERHGAPRRRERAVQR